MLPPTLRSIIAEEVPGAIAFRRDLHMHPEIGYEEKRTADRIRGALDEAGVAHRGGLAGGTGTLASLPGDATHAVALRADIDALPITEAGCPAWKSTIPGRMHACGHDGHTAILVATARSLARYARHSTLPRPVTFVFQPAEEGGAGGRRMCEDGCLDGTVIGPRVERIYGLHGWTTLPLGTVATKPGPLFACSDRFEIVIHGEGSHAAFPQRSRDPVLAAAQVILALQSIVSRNVDPLDSAVVSATVVRAGDVMNVIPPTATIQGTARALLPDVRDLVEKRFGDVTRAAAAVHGCTADAQYIRGYPVTSNDPNEAARFDRLAKETLGEERVRTMDRPVMGGEDFSYYAERVPACFFALGLIPHGATSMPSLHHPAFDFNDDAIVTGVEMMCALALSA
ncbi:MAG: amidohydrolase [Phycisphaerae bacterium]|nr:amidohydrolase [Phycisphaerae bacterium]